MTLTIVSGGSTGAERGALQAAIDMGLAIDGWRCAGDDIPPIFAGSMRETSSTDRGMARRLCVQDSDGTLALSRAILAHTVVAWVDKWTERTGKPFLSVVVGDKMPDSVRGSVADWMRDNDVKRLYITGPAEDDEPGITAAARKVVRWLFEGEALDQLGKFIDVVKLLEGAVDSDQPRQQVAATGGEALAWEDTIQASIAEVDKHQVHGAQVPDDFGPTDCRGEPLDFGPEAFPGDTSAQTDDFGPATRADLAELDAVPEPVDSDAPGKVYAQRTQAYRSADPPEGLDEAQRADLDATIRQAERDIRGTERAPRPGEFDHCDCPSHRDQDGNITRRPQPPTPGDQTA